MEPKEQPTLKDDCASIGRAAMVMFREIYPKGNGDPAEFIACLNAAVEVWRTRRGLKAIDPLAETPK